MPRRSRSCLFESLESRTLLAGDLDPSFGTEGLLFDEISHDVDADDRVAEATVDAEGRIIVAARSISGRGNSVALARILPTGSIDTSFGQQGKVLLSVASGSETVKDVVVLPDGKLVVLSEITNADSNNSRSVQLTRLLPNGDLDLTFGNGGMLNSLNRYPNHIQPVAVVGGGGGSLFVLSTQGVERVVLSKHLASGGLDLQFGNAGLAQFEGMSSHALDLLALPDGSILVASEVSGLSNGYDMQIRRVLTSGTADMTFGSGGVVTIPLADNGIYAYYGQARLALSPDGQHFFVAGTRRTEYAQDFFVRKLTLTGLPVTSFGNGGERFIYSGQSWGTLLQDLEVHDNGWLSLTGTLGYPRYPTLVRIDPAGNVDLSLSSGGYSMAYGVYTRDDIGAAVLLPNGRLVAAVTDVPSEDIRLISYRPDGTRDNDFGTYGSVLINFRSQWIGTDAQDIMELPDGRLLSVAVDRLQELVNGGRTGPWSIVLTRYTRQGQIDTSYGVGGRAVYASSVNTEGLPPAFLSCGQERFLAFQERFNLRVARLTDTGEIDGGFGTQGWIEWTMPSSVSDPPGDWKEIDAVLPTVDGFIVSGHGNSLATGEFYFSIIKLDRTGAPIAAFGESGAIRIPSQPAAAISQIERLSDGRFVILMNPVASGSFFQTVLQRYDVDGRLDTSFGTNGTCYTGLVSADNSNTRRLLAVLPDDRLVVLGTQWLGPGVTRIVAAGFSADGELDPTFGPDGNGKTPLPAIGASQTPVELVADSRGHVLVSISVTDYLQTDSVVYRLTPGGQVDASFGDSGKVVLPLSGFNDRIKRLVTTASGDYLGAGVRTTKDAKQAVYLRLLEGALPPSPWQNAAQPLDSNASLQITPLDALLVINYLNSGASRKLPGLRPPDTTLGFIDVNGDRNVSPIDALLVINELNLRRSAGGEGEASDRSESRSENWSAARHFVFASTWVWHSDPTSDFQGKKRRLHFSQQLAAARRS